MPFSYLVAHISCWNGIKMFSYVNMIPCAIRSRGGGGSSSGGGGGGGGRSGGASDGSHGGRSGDVCGCSDRIV